MTNKNLAVLGAAAVVLGAAAYFLNGGAGSSAPKLNGRRVTPAFELADVARVEIGGKLTLAAGEKGWTVETCHGYPADRDKIAENLLKLGPELKVGQVVRGKKLEKTTPVTLKDASGKELVKLALGDKHSKWGHGRYALFDGETVLLSDQLDAFDGDVKQWCNTRIASISSSDVKAVAFRHGKESVELEKGTNSTWTLKGLGPKEELDTSKTYSLDSALSYLDFNSVADPKLTEAELGFATGYVYEVTFTEGSNTVKRTATVGNTVKGGGDRYFKLDDRKWIFTISSYSAENMMKTRKDLVKAKPEPPKSEPAKTEPAKTEPKKAAAGKGK
ncbi:MAG: DUF4340 domain-containing protein [Kiritimatiellae bacterium]|nr:DUF4340 domain-containing protein [Kiritimatiellia bacterium]